MPQLIKHIDAIAREKQRDVLFIHFEHYEETEDDDENESMRSIVISWLEDHGIGYDLCMGLEQEGYVDTYAGDIYIDLPYDESNPAYQELSLYLEDDQGNMMLDGVLFFVLSLEIALEIEADRKESEINESQLDDEIWSGKPS